MLRIILLSTTCVVLFALAQCNGQKRGSVFSSPVHHLPPRAPVVGYQRYQPASLLPTPQPLVAVPVSSSLQVGRSDLPFDTFQNQNEDIDFDFLAKQLKSKLQTHVQSQRKFLQNGIQKRYENLQSLIQTKCEIITWDIEAINNTITSIAKLVASGPPDEHAPSLRMDATEEVPNLDSNTEQESNTLLSMYALLADFNQQSVSRAPHKWISKLFEFDTFLARNSKVQFSNLEPPSRHSTPSEGEGDNDFFATIWITMGTFAVYADIVLDYFLQFL